MPILGCHETRGRAVKVGRGKNARLQVPQDTNHVRVSLLRRDCVRAEPRREMGKWNGSAMMDYHMSWDWEIDTIAEVGANTD